MRLELKKSERVASRKFCHKNKWLAHEIKYFRNGRFVQNDLYYLTPQSERDPRERGKERARESREKGDVQNKIPHHAPVLFLAWCKLAWRAAIFHPLLIFYDRARGIKFGAGKSQNDGTGRQ
jgi:hypothetical protein